MITARVNGKQRRFEKGVTLSGVLAELKLDARLVAVELNGNIVRRDSFDSYQLADGDRLEIVRFVQGG